MFKLTLIQGVILSYFIIIYGIGFLKKSKSDKDSFIFAGRRLTLPAFVATLVSTWYGGILEVGRFSYENGIVTILIFGVFYYLAAISFALFFAPKIATNNIQSIPSLIYSHFGKIPGIISIILILLIASPAPYLKIFSILIQSFWEIPEYIAIIIGISISVLYSIRGGFSSIVRTDKLQFVLMFLGFGLMLWKLNQNFGGFNFLQKNASIELFQFPGNFSWPSIFVWGFIALITFIDPGFFQRSFSGADVKTVKRGIFISVGFWIIFDLMTVTTGIYAAAILPQIDTSPYLDLAKLVLSPITYSIFIISLFSIVMSTIDSFTFISAYTLGMDLPPILNLKIKNNSVNNTKFSLIIISILSFILSMFFNNAIEMWYILGSIAVPVLLMPILAGLYHIKIKQPLRQFLFPLLITLSWFYVGFNNLDTWGYPQYLFQLDPMYPGLLISFTMFIILKRKKL
jgi:solute:Na+ symporter, SSS family